MQRLADAYLKGSLGKRKDQVKAIRYLRQAAEGADRDYPQALYVSQQVGKQRAHINMTAAPRNATNRVLPKGKQNQGEHTSYR